MHRDFGRPVALLATSPRSHYSIFLGKHGGLSGVRCASNLPYDSRRPVGDRKEAVFHSAFQKDQN